MADSQKAIIDVDGILWPYHKVLFRILSARHGVPTDLPTKWDWYLDHGVTQEQAEDAFDEMHYRQMWANPFPGARALVDACMSKFGCVIIASHRKPKFGGSLDMWLLQHGITAFSGLYVGPRKAALFEEGDLVIDDSPRNISAAVRKGAVPITLAWPWNENTKALRFETLEEMTEWITKTEG